MNCRRFANLLWEQPSAFIVKDKLPPDMLRHMGECASCRNEYNEFIGFFTISQKSELVKDEAYWQNFESTIFEKISSLETADARRLESTSGRRDVGRTSISLKHLLASLSIAAASVVLIMIAVSNITQQIPILEKPDLLAKGQHIAPYSNLSQQTPALNIILNRSLDGHIEMGEFSILPKPEVSIVNDSALVTIDEAYLTDDGLKDKNVPVAKALSRDVVLNSSHLDSTTIAPMNGLKAEVAPEEWVITVEKMPKMIKAVPPDYPSFAYKLKKGGEVWVKAFVNAEGHVERAKIYHDSGTDYGFEEAAIEAAYKNRFEPFEADGVKTPIWVIYKVRFVAKE